MTAHPDLPPPGPATPAEVVDDLDRVISTVFDDLDRIEGRERQVGNWVLLAEVITATGDRRVVILPRDPNDTVANHGLVDYAAILSEGAMQPSPTHDDDPGGSML